MDWGWGGGGKDAMIWRCLIHDQKTQKKLAQSTKYRAQ